MVPNPRKNRINAPPKCSKAATAASSRRCSCSSTPTSAVKVEKVVSPPRKPVMTSSRQWGSRPGKALKTISLLSGGEKAFVAIALYFAILKVHPTPFCIMDEIEAALDEANVVRTARYMRTLADKTQFIVITHRRGTMEAADVLYGITMQEQGVSKILTINLNDMAKELKIQ